LCYHWPRKRADRCFSSLFWLPVRLQQGAFYPGSGATWQVLNVLIQAEPKNIAARKLRIEILKEIGSQDYCLMSRHAWVYSINKDKEFLCSKGEL
jgi:hypothetical protein